MKKYLLIAALSIVFCTTGCKVMNQTKRTMKCNKWAIETSTESIQRNTEAIESVNAAIEDNIRELESINEALKKAG